MLLPQVKNLIVVPVSFVSEHIETLEEIDMEYRELAEECGVTKWTRVPAMNTDPGFIADLADLVVSVCVGGLVFDAVIFIGSAFSSWNQLSSISFIVWTLMM